MTTESLAPTPTSVGSWRWLLSDTLVFAGRNIAHIKEIPEKLIDVTIQPLMFVVLFAYVFGGAIDVPGGSYREYLIGGILIQSLAFGIVGPAQSISTDLTEGVIDRFVSLPTSRTAYLLGHVVAEMAGMALAITILSFSGLVVGWRTHTGVIDVVEGYLLLLLFAAAIIWMGTLIGLLVRSADAVTGVAFLVVFPMTFLSNAFVPIDTLPTVLKYAAAYNPISTLVVAIREQFGNPTAPVSLSVWPLEHAALASLLWCVVLIGISVPLTVARFRQRTIN
ncbi:MAG: ABC transporter permease [Chloroflexota bacterium]